MAEEPRYTREEWEDLQAEEREASRQRAKERGDLFCLVYLAGDDIRRLPREQMEDLLAAKLEQARSCFLKELG
jgi:hypothetical protein